MNDPLLIAFLIACFCSIWATELTKLDGGLLWFVPKIYPHSGTFIGKALRCSICLSGWCCLATCLILGHFFWAIPAMFVSMSIAKIISK